MSAHDVLRAHQPAHPLDAYGPASPLGARAGQPTAREGDTTAALARFGAAVLRVFHNNGERGDVDGGELQEMAVQAGVIVPAVRTTPCALSCPCAGFCGVGESVACYPVRSDVWRAVTSAEVWGAPAEDRVILHVAEGCEGMGVLE